MEDDKYFYNLRNTIDWITLHMRSESGIEPDTEVINMFKKNDWLYAGIVYRGIHNPDNKFKIGDKFIIEKKFSSWTKNKKIASCFAAIGAYDIFVLSDNNSKFTFKERLCMRMKYYGDKNGIVIKAKIKNGLNIEQAIIEIEETKLGWYLLQNMPMLAESEILSLKPVKGKVILHFNDAYCK